MYMCFCAALQGLPTRPLSTGRSYETANLMSMIPSQRLECVNLYVSQQES